MSSIRIRRNFSVQQYHTKHRFSFISQYLQKLFYLLVVLSMVSACARNGTMPDDHAITLAAWNGEEAEILKKVAVDYEEVTGNKVSIVTYGSDSYYDHVWGGLLAGNMDADIVLAKADWVPGWIRYKLVRNLNEASLTRNLITPTVNDFSMAGEIYGVPLETDYAVLFYQADILQELGLNPPATWLDLAEVSEEIQRQKQINGFVIPLAPSEAGSNFLPFLAGFGGELVSSHGKVLDCCESNGREALDYIFNVVQKFQLDAPSSFNLSSAEVELMFVRRKTAFMIGWLTSLRRMGCSEGSAENCHPNFAAALLPGVKGKDGNVHRMALRRQTGLVVPRVSAQNGKTVVFLTWLSSSAGRRSWVLNGGIPANNVDCLGVQSTVDANIDLLLMNMPVSVSFPAIMNDAQIASVLNQKIFEGVSGQLNSVEVVQQIRQEISVEINRGILFP